MELKLLLKFLFLFSGFLFVFPAGMGAFWKLFFSLIYRLYTKISKPVHVKRLFYLLLLVYLYTHEFFHYIVALCFGCSPKLKVNVEKCKGEVLYYLSSTSFIGRSFRAFVINTAPFLIPLFFDLCIVAALCYFTSDYVKFFTCYFMWLFLTSYFRLPSEGDLKGIIE